MKKWLFLLLLLPSLSFAENLKLYPFSYNGPQEKAYLAQALQDSFLAGLKDQGHQVQIKSKALNPDRLIRKKELGTIAARLNWVENTLTVKIVSWNKHGTLVEDFVTYSSSSEAMGDLRKIAKKLVAKSELRPVPSHAILKKAPEPKPQPVQKSIMKLPKRDLPKVSKIQPFSTQLSDYRFRSQRLPFQARAMIHQDLNQDGVLDILIASDSKIHVYHRAGKVLAKKSFFLGKKLDRFVKLSSFTLPQGGLGIAVTNLRGEQASSLILSLDSSNQLNVIAEKIPYLLREIDYEGQRILACEKYNARESLRHQIYEANLSGSKVKVGRKLKLPYEASLFAFEWVYTNAGKELLLLANNGQLKLYAKQGDRYKKRWTSSEKFGGSFNSVKVNIRNALGEVVKDRFTLSMPVKVIHKESNGQKKSDVLLVKNGPFLRSALGRGFLLKNAYLLKLNWNDLGFTETWKSQKIEGGFADYDMKSTQKGYEVMGVARLRHKGFMSPTQVNESIVFIYDLGS